MDDLTCTDFLRTFARTTGARIYANSRLYWCHARVEKEVARDIKEFVEVCAATHERCRRKFFKANELTGAVFGACGSRDPRSEYEARAAAGWPQAAAAGWPRQRWPPPQGGHMGA